MHKQPPKQTVTVSALLGLFLVLLGASPALAQETISLSPGQAEKIETIVQKEMQEARIPGLSLAIVAKKQLVYARGFGLADREASTPATAETVYRTASLAKPITATAAMQLWEQGKLDLDAPIQRYCPVFPEKKSPISTRQLLGHLSGIRHNKKKEVSSTKHYETIKQALTLFQRDKLLHPPGKKFSYSTHGYTVAGCVIEGASGQSFLEYIRANILEPAGMPQTGPDNIHEQVTHRARGYRKNMIWLIVASDQVDTSYKRPGGGLVSTAPDMARFAVAILNQKLVNSETLAAMWTNQKLSNGKESPWGLGWQVMTGTESGVHWALHAGQQPEVSSLLMVATEQGYSVVLMSNLERIASTSLLAIAKEINKIVLKGN